MDPTQIGPILYNMFTGFKALKITCDQWQCWQIQPNKGVTSNTFFFPLFREHRVHWVHTIQHCQLHITGRKLLKSLKSITLHFCNFIHSLLTFLVQTKVKTVWLSALLSSNSPSLSCPILLCHSSSALLLLFLPFSSSLLPSSGQI